MDLGVRHQLLWSILIIDFNLADDDIRSVLAHTVAEKSVFSSVFSYLYDITQIWNR